MDRSGRNVAIPRSRHLGPIVLRRKPAPQAVLGDDARKQKVPQIFAAAGLCSASAHPETAERLPANKGPGDRPIDVKVATDQFVPDALDIHRAARVTAAGQRELAVVCHRQRFLEIPGPGDRQHRTEDFFTENTATRFHLRENGRRDVTRIRAVGRPALPRQRRLVSARLDHPQECAAALDDR